MIIRNLIEENVTGDSWRPMYWVTVRVVNPYPNKTFIDDRIIERRIGPRPWSEISFWDKDKATGKLTFVCSFGTTRPFPDRKIKR